MRRRTSYSAGFTGFAGLAGHDGGPPLSFFAAILYTKGKKGKEEVDELNKSQEKDTPSEVYAIDAKLFSSKVSLEVLQN